MPELPDITLYLERLQATIGGATLLGVRLASPFLLRSVTPPVATLCGRQVQSVERLGKRLVLGFGDTLYAVLHLMIAGRLRWRPAGAKIPGQVGLAAFDFSTGTLLFTEASKKKRASLHLVSGRQGLAAFDRGGLDVLTASAAAMLERLHAERHTLKRALTDPTLFDGIGNAYSDEILHAARMSPFCITTAMTEAEAETLAAACRRVLTTATAALRAEVGDGFPETVTAFRPDMAVHGKYGQPCPVCGQKVCRIVYAENEANYCATCQTGGKLLADRSLSRLMREDWPRSLEELEERKAERAAQWRVHEPAPQRAAAEASATPGPGAPAPPAPPPAGVRPAAPPTSPAAAPARAAPARRASPSAPRRGPRASPRPAPRSDDGPQMGPGAGSQTPPADAPQTAPRRAPRRASPR